MIELLAPKDSRIKTKTKPKSPGLMLKQNRWQLDQVIPPTHQISQQFFIQAPVDVVQNFKDLLSRDVFSEGDAQVLYDHIQSRQAEMNPDFLTMLELWLEDELKHYEGLRRTYHCIAGVSFGAMDQMFEKRSPDLNSIKVLLESEFTILVTLMFDEIGSVYSYRRDLREYYGHFGKEIRQMGHHLIRDEGAHFNNAAELLLNLHGHRLPEVRKLLSEIVTLENSLGKYHQAFFLDHAQEQHRFPPNFNQLLIQVVLARLRLAPLPAPQDLKQLWQWTPAGHSYTPI